MEKQNPIKEKSLAFAFRMVDLNKHLLGQQEYVISKQVLASGTSIGANVEEANQAQSRKDFVSKMSIALKEAHETRFWLTLLHHGEYISSEGKESLLKDIRELIALLTRIIKTSKSH